MIIEIAFDLTNVWEQQELESLLEAQGYTFYVEPPNRFASLDDCQCQCEGK